MASIFFWKIYHYGQSQYAFTVIIKQLYLGYKIIYITVSLDIFVVDIILLSNCSQMELSLLISSKDNLADPLTKCLSGERINCASRGMGLKA